jgi:branched-chain amino acid transport system substrate-binding protein
MNRSMRFAAVGLTAAAVALSACAAPGSSDESKDVDSYTLGVMLPLTGQLATVGQGFQTGIQMAAEEINADGGIDGKDLKVVFEDTKGTPEGGVAAINKFTSVEKAPMVITATSGQTLSAQPIAEQRHAVLMNVGGVSPNLLDLPYLYNNAVNITSMGPTLAQYLWEQGYRKLAFLGAADPFGEGTVEAVSPVWEELGGTIVENQSVAATDTDLTGQILKIKSAGPDVVVATAVGEVLGQMVQQARSSGLNVPMAGPLATEGLTSVAGADAEGFVDISMTVADPATAPDSPTAQFVADYQAEFDTAPSWIPGTAYETAYLFKSLVEQAIENGDDPTDGEVLSELIKGASFDDILQGGGDVTFIEDHSVSRLVAIREVKDGAFQVLETVEAGGDAS